MVVIMSNELYHHGILGQKWGKRNGPPYPLDASDHSASEKKAGWRNSLKKDQANNNTKAFDRGKVKKIALATASVAGIGVGLYLAYKTGAVDMIASLLGNGASMDECSEAMSIAADEMEHIIPNGTFIHRMSAYPDWEPGDAYAFAAYTDPDVTAYMTLLNDWEGTGERYDVALRAIKDLRVPSKQKALEVFNELWDNEPEFKDQVFSLVKRSYDDLVDLGIYTPEKVDRILSNTLAEDPLRLMVHALAIRSTQAQKYIERLKNEGYDALIDYYDQGNMADQPLVILDPKGSIQKVGELFVDKNLKLDRLSSLQEKGILYFSAENRSVEEVMKMIEEDLL